MAWTRSPEKVLLARAGARHRWRDAAGAVPLVASALLWAWVLAGVLGPLGGTMSAIEAPGRAVVPRQPTRAAMVACAPPDEPSGAGALADAARLRHR